MNSYYHPREHDQDSHDYAHAHPGAPSAYVESHSGTYGHEEHAAHTEYEGNDALQGQNDEQATQDSQYSEKELDMFRVLVAVERGELSAHDAARKLEELEAPGQGEGNSEPA